MTNDLDGGQPYVVLVDGAPADFFASNVTGEVMDGAGLMIHKIWVPPSQRGSGVGSQLMSRWIDYSDRHGIVLCLVVAPDADCPIDVAAWYERLGFEHGPSPMMLRRPTIGP